MPHLTQKWPNLARNRPNLAPGCSHELQAALADELAALLKEAPAAKPAEVPAEGWAAGAQKASGIDRADDKPFKEEESAYLKFMEDRRAWAGVRGWRVLARVACLLLVPLGGAGAMAGRSAVLRGGRGPCSGRARRAGAVRGGRGRRRGRSARGTGAYLSSARRSAPMIYEV